MWSLLAFLILSAHAQPDVTPMDIERLSGFAEHKKLNKDFDKDREAGLKEWILEQRDWEEQRKKAIKEQQGLRKEENPAHGMKAYKEHLEDQKIWKFEQEVARKEVLAEKNKLRMNPLTRNISEEEELDILSKRPRYEIRKRALYSSRGTRSGGGGGYTPTRPDFGGGNDQGGSSNFLPPPPPAPPSFPDDDFPPPPPPPMMGEEDFPPPPPPPVFDDVDGGDFPPPPPPPGPDGFIPDL